MKPRLEYVGRELEGIRRDGLYRRLQSGSVAGPYITINGKRMVNLCSNDYLGIPPTGVTGGRQMQSSSRLVSGNDAAYERLEGRLARHKSQQSALVFPTGYMANLGAVTGIAGRGDVIFSDELNHASIIEASRLSGARITVYRHNDTEDLRDKIRGAKAAAGRRKFVVTEGVFSMDGDFARLDEIVEIAEKGGCVTVLDDAHGDFVVGRGGRGTPNRYGVSKRIDVYTSSLSKGLGSFGGYVASQDNVVELCVNRSKPFIYTSALPGALVSHALERLGADHGPRRAALARNTRAVAGGLRGMGYEIGSSQSHIIPIVIGSERTAVEFGRYLAGRGVFAQPIRYPTVAKGGARIRISVTAWLRDAHIEKALGAFERAGKKFGVT